jgi:hypothetical protein
MDAPTGDTFHAVCIIAAADQIEAARQGAWEFHRQDSPRFAGTIEGMLPHALSPTGAAPATHYLCTRHDTQEALSRIELYQKQLVVGGKPRVPVVLEISEETVIPDGTLPVQLAALEPRLLARLSAKLGLNVTLRRIA